MAEKTTEEPGKPASDKTSGTSGKADGDKTGDGGTTTEVTTERRKRRGTAMKADVKAIRTAIARLVWVVCLVFAFVLAATVLLIAIEANPANDLVEFLKKFADNVDLGFFDLMDPVKDFDKKSPPGQDTKTALFNYGIAAIVWLVIGRIADRIIRP